MCCEYDKIQGMKDFKQLNVWDKAHDFVLNVYKISENFPKAEDFRITSQLLRAASSIPTNIAEGSGRSTDPDFGRFIQIAIGSCSEAEYLLILCKDLKYINLPEYEKLVDELIIVRKMLINLKKQLRY